MKRTFLLTLMLVFSCGSVRAESPEKLWASDWITYRNTSAADVLRGQSSRACLSENEAFVEASRDAANQLIDIASLPHRKETVDSLAAAIQQGRFVKDRSVERIEKPYGILYQASILVNSSESALAPFKKQIENELRSLDRRQREHRLVKTIFTIGSIVAMSLLCIGADLLTKGYFTWRLRLASLVAIIAAVGGIHTLL